MSTLLSLTFEDPALSEALTRCTGSELDALDFGVIGFALSRWSGSLAPSRAPRVTARIVSR